MTIVLRAFRSQYQKQTPLLLWMHARTQSAFVLDTEGETGLLAFKMHPVLHLAQKDIRLIGCR